jgi:hypothetical protein
VARQLLRDLEGYRALWSMPISSARFASVCGV